MGTAAVFTNGRYQRRSFFGSGSAAVFLAEKVAPLQHCFLSKFFAAAATANELLPRLFQFTFSHVTVWSLYSPLVFTLLLLEGPTLALHVPWFLLGHFPTNECKISDFCL